MRRGGKEIQNEEKNIDKVVNKLIEMDGKINDFVVFVVL